MRLLLELLYSLLLSCSIPLSSLFFTLYSIAITIRIEISIFYGDSLIPRSLDPPMTNLHGYRRERVYDRRAGELLTTASSGFHPGFTLLLLRLHDDFQSSDYPADHLIHDIGNIPRNSIPAQLVIPS